MDTRTTQQSKYINFHRCKMKFDVNSHDKNK